MRKLLLYFLVNSFLKDSDKSFEIVKNIANNSKPKMKFVDIYEGLFDDKKEVEFEIDGLIDHEEIESNRKPKSKKDELLASLSYLKSKPNKTKQDRESIYTLEMVLKSM